MPVSSCDLWIKADLRFAPRFERLKKFGSRAPECSLSNPIRGGIVFTGTFRNDIMYDGMIKSFNSATGSLGEEEPANVYARLELDISGSIVFYVLYAG